MAHDGLRRWPALLEDGTRRDGMRTGRMKLGVFLTATGQHAAAWRDADVPADMGACLAAYAAVTRLAAYAAVTRLAERGRFGLMILADNAGIWQRNIDADGRSARAAYFEPITPLSALAALTERIGLVATMTASFNEPYNLARCYASLDHLSGGAAGWNLVTSANEAEAFDFGHDRQLAHADRYARAREFGQVVLGLWDSLPPMSPPAPCRCGAPSLGGYHWEAIVVDTRSLQSHVRFHLTVWHAILPHHNQGAILPFVGFGCSIRYPNAIWDLRRCHAKRPRPTIDTGGEFGARITPASAGRRSVKPVSRLPESRHTSRRS
jgi:alkanesulfonate monooxygenase SsuD/methylene tetrahydromethanopterin reductase-like flavin-dependent oxidoreductase (luciferase family)